MSLRDCLVAPQFLSSMSFVILGAIFCFMVAVHSWVQCGAKNEHDEELICEELKGFYPYIYTPRGLMSQKFV